MSEEAISALTSLGLSSGEARTYLGLVTVGTSQATPLAEIADVPQPRIYAYLDSLVSKGLVTKETITGKPNIYTAQEYEVVFSILRQTLDKKIERAKIYIESERKKTEPQSVNVARIIQGHQAIQMALESLAVSTQQNIYTVHTAFYDDMIERIFGSKGIEIYHPLELLQNSPIMHLMKSSAISSVFESKRACLIMVDVDPKHRKTSSFNILAYADEGSEVDPLMVQIYHPVILDLQIDVVLSVIESLTKGMNSID